MKIDRIKRKIAKKVFKSWEIRIKVPVFFLFVLGFIIPAAYADSILLKGASFNRYAIICMVEALLVYIGYLIGINHPKLNKFEEFIKHEEEQASK